jgi:hypothetical protein
MREYDTPPAMRAHYCGCTKQCCHSATCRSGLMWRSIHMQLQGEVLLYAVKRSAAKRMRAAIFVGQVLLMNAYNLSRRCESTDIV